jgi:DNA-binding HxlR family transcriptional regulator
MYERKIPRNFHCGISIIMEIIGGKWKAYILYLVQNEIRRPSELNRLIPSATLRVLNKQLSELENHGILKKIIYPEMPPRVEYFLTEFGLLLIPIVNAMDQWGNDHGNTFRELIKTRPAELLTDNSANN